MLILGSFSAGAQIGGYGVYQSLALPPSARTSALGGYQIAVLDKELSLGLQNPALLNEEMHGQMGFSQVNYIADINYGYAGYAHSIDSQLTFMGAVQYVNFGDFERADEFGNRAGTFTGGDNVISLGLGYAWSDQWRFGANLKFIYSHMANYYSAGIALDLAATHHWEEKQLTSSLVIRNLGMQLTTYDGNNEPLPLDIQLAFSKRLADAPFRLNVTAHHLNIPDMTYINTNLPERIDLETGQPIEQKVPFTEKIFRHFIVGTEILLSENFHLRVGYNHQRRKELTLERAKGGIGYSWGFGLRIWRFNIDYGRATYHFAGASHHFSIMSNLSSWTKK